MPKRTQFDCSVAGCERAALARHLCTNHYALWRRHGDPLVNLRSAKARHRATLDWRNLQHVQSFGWAQGLSGGYRIGTWPEHPNAGKHGRVHQHVAVMAALLGRPLAIGETVHHKNGVRHDNRPENLELWVKAHPAGQRVSELVAFAHEVLERYGDDLQLWPEDLIPNR